MTKDIIFLGIMLWLASPVVLVVLLAGCLVCYLRGRK